MVNLVLISENEHECNVLTVAFEQYGIKVLCSTPSYQNYVYVMQFMPDLIVMEIPHTSIEHLNFSNRIRSFKKTRGIIILGYGNKTDQSVMNGIIKNGISAYIERPLKFGVLMQRIEYFLKLQKKSLTPKKPLTEKEQDLALILGAEATPVQKIEAMARHIGKLMAFPFTVAKVMQITNNEQAGAQQLATAINADPYMAAYLLKVSNSVFFASANRRINSITDAIVRIGFNETKRIVLGMSIITLFTGETRNSGFDRTLFWSHSLAVAIVAEKIAKSFGDVNLDEAFLAGLLHDFGIMLLDDFFPSVLDKVLQVTSQNGGLFYDYEKSEIKVTHLDLIADLFPKWKIPQNITKAITLMYDLSNEDFVVDSPEKKLSVCIAIGNATAKMLRIGKECDEFVAPFNNEIFRQAKLPNGISPAAIHYINQQIAFYSNFLSLEKKSDRTENDNENNMIPITAGLYNPGKSLFVPPALFLISHGIKYEIIPADADLESCQEKYDVIFYWDEKPIDSAIIKRLGVIRRKNSGKHFDVSTSVQLIVMAPGSKELPKEECLAFENKIDYRNLEVKLHEMNILTSVVST